MNKGFYIVVATDELNGIGLRGQMPWHIKGEMKHFRNVTTKTEDPSKENVVIMGRATWESLPEQFRPLPGRRNVVLTRNSDYSTPGAETAPSLEHALAMADESNGDVFVIGGQKVYEQAIHNPDLSGVYLTRIEHEFDCDTFFPEIPEEFNQIESLGREVDDDLHYEFFLYTKR